MIHHTLPFSTPPVHHPHAGRPGSSPPENLFPYIAAQTSLCVFMNIWRVINLLPTVPWHINAAVNKCSSRGTARCGLVIISFLLVIYHARCLVKKRKEKKKQRKEELLLQTQTHPAGNSWLNASDNLAKREPRLRLLFLAPRDPIGVLATSEKQSSWSLKVGQGTALWAFLCGKKRRLAVGRDVKRSA